MEYMGNIGYVKCLHTHADAEDQRENLNKTVMVRKQHLHLVVG